jgi:hypothetical protein
MSYNETFRHLYVKLWKNFAWLMFSLCCVGGTFMRTPVEPGSTLAGDLTKTFLALFLVSIQLALVLAAIVYFRNAQKGQQEQEPQEPRRRPHRVRYMPPVPVREDQGTDEFDLDYEPEPLPPKPRPQRQPPPPPPKRPSNVPMNPDEQW